MFYVNTTVILNWYPLNAYSSEQQWSRANTALFGSDRTKIDTKEKNWYYNSKYRITQTNQTDILADLNFELIRWRLFQKQVFIIDRNWNNIWLISLTLYCVVSSMGTYCLNMLFFNPAELNCEKKSLKIPMGFYRKQLHKWSNSILSFRIQYKIMV